MNMILSTRFTHLNMCSCRSGFRCFIYHYALRMRRGFGRRGRRGRGRGRGRGGDEIMGWVREERGGNKDLVVTHEPIL